VPVNAPRSNRSKDLRGIERVLDLLLDPLRHDTIDSWRHDVTCALGPLLGADRMSFQLPHPGVDLLYNAEMDRGTLKTYTQHFIPQLDRRKNYSRRIITLGVGNRRAMWGHDLAWLYRSAYYNECIVPMRAFGPVWASARVPGQSRPAVLLAHADRRRGHRMGERELGILRVLRPALSAAVRTVHRLHAHRAALATTVDAIDTGVLLFAANGRLLHENPAARRLGNRVGGRLLQARAAQVARTAMAAPAWIGNGSAPPGPAATDDTAGLRLRPARMASAGGEGDPAALVLVEELASPLLTVADVRARARLTSRQAEVALLLAQRRTNAEIARELNVSAATARHHTEAVMTALGVHRRVDVARRLETLRD
jgi:DNA-binding CsgD family transcriptional regulator